MSAFFLALLMQAAVPPAPPSPAATAPATAATSDTPVPQSADSPEEIAKDSARDLKDSRYYNKPGATRADYDRDWQEKAFLTMPDAEREAWFNRMVGAEQPEGKAVIAWTGEFAVAPPLAPAPPPKN